MKSLNISLIFLVIFSACIFSGCRKSSEHRHVRKSEYSSSTRTKENAVERSSRKTRKSEDNSNRSKSSHALSGSEVFDKYGSAVFMVFTSDGTNGFQGSGFFIDNKGLAVSNYHVFKGTKIGQEQIKLLGSDVAYNVKEVIERNSDRDFILFRVDCSNTNYIPIAKSKPKVGERVFAIGSPRGLENTFSSGEISQWRGDYLMQISNSIDHGSSGGALINEHGEVVGITSGTFVANSQANLNYAWSIEAIKPYLK